MLGSAAACSRLMGLDTQKTTMALGIAASQPVGMREQFGTMTKPFHPGGAARAGQLSALLAKHGFTASPKALEAGRCYMQTVSTKCDCSEIDRELCKLFEISLNTYKPFACGIVIHPAIDACAQLKAQGVKAEEVERIELRVHPLVLELTGKKTPKDGLEGKFSVYHGCAVGLIFGQAGEGEYADDIVNRPDVVALRAKVNATTDTSISEASVDVKAILKDGREVHVFVKNAIGSVENPMSDANLEQKFTGLTEPVIGKEKTSQLIAALWNLGSAPDLKKILSLCTPD
jgi:2-methylcitrate dehydratase PrpD